MNNMDIIERVTIIKNAIKSAILAIAMGAFSSSAFAGAGDIVDTAAGNENFSTLVAAVKAAGLVETLKDDGPFTIFAPTNEAFAALPAGTIENLMKPENKDKLVAVLSNHVVPGIVMSGDLKDDMTATTAPGGSLTVELYKGVMVNEAHVVTADISTSNGVIHVIDKVILPN